MQERRHRTGGAGYDRRIVILDFSLLFRSRASRVAGERIYSRGGISLSRRQGSLNNELIRGLRAQTYVYSKFADNVHSQIAARSHVNFPVLDSRDFAPPSLDLSLYFRSNSEFSKFLRSISTRKEDYSPDFKLYLSTRVDRSEFACYSCRRIFSTPPTPAAVENSKFYREQVSFNILRKPLRDIKYPGAVL